MRNVVILTLSIFAFLFLAIFGGRFHGARNLATSQLAAPYASGQHLAARTPDNVIKLSGDYLWRFVYAWDGTRWEQRDLGQLLNLSRDNTAGSLSHADNRFIIAGVQSPVSFALSQLGATPPQYLAFWSANLQNNNWCGGCDEAGNKGRWQVVNLTETQKPAISDIELALPSYFPEELRHPQKFFSGRKIRIHLEGPENLKELRAELGNKATAGKRQLSVTNKELVVQKQERTAAILSDAVEVEIPVDIETGIYDLIISLPAQERIIWKSALEINGNADAEEARQHEEVVQKIVISTSPAIVSRTVIHCGEFCGWETVITGNESGGLLIVGLHSPFRRGALGSFSYSRDSGMTWIKDDVDRFFFGEIPEDRYPPFSYNGDPNIVSNEEQFFLSSLGGSGGALYRGCVWGAQCEPKTQLFETTGADRPLIAMDEETGTIYIVSHNASFLRNDGRATSGTALYVLENEQGILRVPIEQQTPTEINALLFGRDPSVVPAAHLNDIEVGIDGSVYIAFARDFPRGRDEHEIGVFRISKNPPDFQTTSLLLRNNQNSPNHYAARLSYRSDRTWFVDGGPYLAVDKSAGPHRGRIYALLSYPTMTLSDLSFEYANIGANTDIFLSYSDDQGETWSEPIVVNDDTGTADQYFPSIEVGKDGTVHIAFVDRRDTQGLAQFDIFYTFSRDGGRTFLPNIRVNSTSIPLETGGRRWGDYVDLIHPRSDGMTFIGYPCGNFPNSIGQYPALCVDKIDTSLMK